MFVQNYNAMKNLLLVLIVCVSLSCKKDYSPVIAPNDEGSVMLYLARADAPAIYGNGVVIKIDSVIVDTLTSVESYLIGCGSIFGYTVTSSPKSYKYEAYSLGGQNLQWTGTITIEANKCKKVPL